ncbi:glycosyltransferase [Bacteroides gallinaceum]|uniref:glycosyltransferase n=1 Tax=Bacteroides gallinaceum TaxID=1462571 RepID=UPI0025AB51BE|nr:glycosyltransferase [Bacteroides gallinaceum]MDN0065752.1 glycosyltransferase [Bacteroides gallinaceum]
MNILFLMKVFEVGGQEVVTSTLAQSFVSHGHSVTIVSFKQPNPLMLERLDKRIEVFTLDELCYSKENIEKFRSVLINKQINIVINQWGLPYIPAKVLNEAKKGLAIKTIAVYHNSPDSNARIKEVEIALLQTRNHLKRWMLQCKKFAFKQITSQSMRYVYNHSDLYMVLSPSFIDKFKDFTGIKHPNHLIVQTNPVTVDASDYVFSSEKKWKEIIYMGRIDYNQKRVYRVIDTWSVLEKQFPDWQLTVVGDGPERKKLEQQVKDLGLQHVSFEGFQSSIPYYERTSILILTSEYEGFPLVLAECMSFGVVPVVYGSYSAVYDIIKHKENGMIVQPQNGKFEVNEMAKQLAFVMENESKRNEMAQNAILTSKRDYSLESIYRSWEKVFDKLMQ